MIYVITCVRPFLIHTSIMWICVMSRVRPSGRPSFVAKTLTLDIARRLFNQICSYLLCL